MVHKTGRRVAVVPAKKISPCFKCEGASSLGALFDDTHKSYPNQVLRPLNWLQTFLSYRTICFFDDRIARPTETLDMHVHRVFLRTIRVDTRLVFVLRTVLRIQYPKNPGGKI